MINNLWQYTEMLRPKTNCCSRTFLLQMWWRRVRMRSRQVHVGILSSQSYIIPSHLTVKEPAVSNHVPREKGKLYCTLTVLKTTLKTYIVMVFLCDYYWKLLTIFLPLSDIVLICVLYWNTVIAPLTHSHWLEPPVVHACLSLKCLGGSSAVTNGMVMHGLVVDMLGGETCKLQPHCVCVNTEIPLLSFSLSIISVYIFHSVWLQNIFLAFFS